MKAPRKSASEWAKIVADFTAGGESERTYCVKHDIKLVTLRKWRYRFQSGDKKGSVDDTRSKFTRVNVRSVTQHAAAPGATLCLGTDSRVECPASFDVASLAQLAL